MNGQLKKINYLESIRMKCISMAIENDSLEEKFPDMEITEFIRIANSIHANITLKVGDVEIKIRDD